MATETENPSSSVTWLTEPVTASDILVAAANFRDSNPLHSCQSAAKRKFGEDATGIVAPGAQILGLVGGMLTSIYGEDTVAHELSNVKLSRCICPGDFLGISIEETFDQTRSWNRYVHMNVTILRRRGEEILPICRKHPVYVEIVCPEKQAGSD